MTTNIQVDSRELNKQLEPTEVLRFIGYDKTLPTTSGKEIRDYCPIHKGDKQKSLSISKENHTYICHSCGEKGDLIDLYAKSLNLEFRDAIEQLVAQFQTALPTKKKIPKPPGVRFGKDGRGNHSLVIPFYNVEGELQTMQFINEQEKFFLKESSYKISFSLLGDIMENGHVYIAEGVATATTIREAIEKNTLLLLWVPQVTSPTSLPLYEKNIHPLVSSSLLITAKQP